MDMDMEWNMDIDSSLPALLSALGFIFSTFQ